MGHGVDDRCAGAGAGFHDVDFDGGSGPGADREEEVGAADFNADGKVRSLFFIYVRSDLSGVFPGPQYYGRTARKRPLARCNQRRRSALCRRPPSSFASLASNVRRAVSEILASRNAGAAFSTPQRGVMEAHTNALVGGLASMIVDRAPAPSALGNPPPAPPELAVSANVLGPGNLIAQHRPRGRPGMGLRLPPRGATPWPMPRAALMTLSSPLCRPRLARSSPSWQEKGRPSTLPLSGTVTRPLMGTCGGPPVPPQW